MQTSPALPISEALNSFEQGKLSFVENDIEYGVQRQDLERMEAMGLGQLPIDAIAVPHFSPILQEAEPHLRATLDIARHLSQYFPGHFVAALYELQSILAKTGLQAYVIGGIVRDLVLSPEERRLELKDIDITVEGDALVFSETVVAHSKNFALDERYPEFGTAKLHYKNTLFFDIASTRKEIYHTCGALPDVTERGVPLVEDIIRRDFTINALALSIHRLGLVKDFSNGIEDIQNEEVRVLHAASFFEDPTRILRALKFAARLDFGLCVGTRRLLKSFLRYGPQVYKGGGERMKQELQEFLSLPENSAKQVWLDYFQEKECLPLVNMGLAGRVEDTPSVRLEEVSTELARTQEMLGAPFEPDVVWEIYLCFLLGELEEADFQKAAQRLGLTKAERECVECFRETLAKQTYNTLSNQSSPVDVYKVFHGVAFPAIIAGIIAQSFQPEGHYQEILQAFQRFKRKWEHVHLEIDGNDLIELGVPKGEQIGLILRQVLYAKLTGQLQSRMDEIQFVQEWMEGTEDLSASATAPPPAEESQESQRAASTD